MSAELDVPLPVHKRTASNRTIVLALAGLVCLLYIISVLTTGPPPHRESEHSRTITRRIKSLADATNGDPDRLSPEDRQWLDGMANGHTGELLKMMHARDIEREYRDEDRNGYFSVRLSGKN